MVIPQLKTYTDSNCFREISLPSVSSPEHRRLKILGRWWNGKVFDAMVGNTTHVLGSAANREHCPTNREHCPTNHSPITLTL